MVEKNPSPNRSQTQTTEAAAVFFTEKGNNLNARARSAQSRTDLICHRLLGFDRGMGFVGLQFKGLGSVKKKKKIKGLGFGGLGIMRLWVLLILILIFEWSCYLALETKRGVH